jgi:hypothetical protein
MKAHSSFLPLFLAVCCTAGFAQAVTPSIKIGDHEITVGLPADRVIASLQNDYAVQPDRSTPPRKWVVSAGKDTIPIGVVYARGNTVTGIQYMLKGRETDSAQDVFDVLFEAVSKLSAEGRNTCALTTWSGYVAEASLNKAGISFNCGVYQLDLRRIQITGADTKTATGCMLWESLGATD